MLLHGYIDSYKTYLSEMAKHSLWQVGNLIFPDGEDFERSQADEGELCQVLNLIQVQMQLEKLLLGTEAAIRKTADGIPGKRKRRRKY